MTASSPETHVAVIGGGPAGYAAAFRAADLGLQVTLIDEDTNPGGVCLYRGCIPSKALLHIAKLLHETRAAKDWGLTFGEPRIDLDRLREWKNGVVGKLTTGLGQLCEARRIRFVQGRAAYTDARTLLVTKATGGDESVSVDYSIIATGSLPTRIPGLPTDDARLMDSTTALNLPDVPATLLVIGGGYIGLELGTVYQALGTEVTVVEMTATLLPGADRDLVGILEKELRSRGFNFCLENRVTAVKALKSGLKVSIQDKNGAHTAHTYDRVLVAVGRRPNTAGLGLEHTGVQVDGQGFITVDKQRRTHDARIFAIGDVAGEPMLAHKGSHEGMVAAESIAGHKVAFEPNAIPAVVFTDPEIAWCGLTEEQAKAAGRDVRIATFPWAASGRAATLGRSDGLTKIVTDPDNERVLGIGICGAGAGELIAEGVLALEMAATATDLKLSIHPHPTLTETLMESAELVFGPSTHVHKPRRS